MFVNYKGIPCYPNPFQTMALSLYWQARQEIDQFDDTFDHSPIAHAKEYRTLHLRAHRRSGHTYGLFLLSQQASKCLYVAPSENIMQRSKLNAEELKIQNITFATVHTMVHYSDPFDLILIDSASFIGSERKDKLYEMHASHKNTLFFFMQ